MKSFAGKIAVITGGGAGIGRELALRLVSTGCDIALCDVFPENMAETKRLCLLQEQHGARISIFVADVSIEDQVLAFAEAVTRDLETDHIDLLFNNAGIGALGGSFVDGDRAEWDKTSTYAGTVSIIAHGHFSRCCGRRMKATSSTPVA